MSELHDLIRSHDPAMVLLCETERKHRAMERVKWTLGFRNGTTIGCEGIIGGLPL